ncbi:DUF1189 domain-containing protein [Salibacterium salarium]|uniref:DUF1189 domain-containing protein n=1 Tax=Salibacterium salarium TaxID=284579 RepID=A0A3R9RFU0_9BACI|nr:DUF1189 domain-containing protein [Salibacterium salarium]RSL34514.1 DUF1189 domain-containing protein [Salibacterium salarium]
MNIIQSFIKSLYSPSYTGRFRFKGIGKTIGYIFFLMFIASIPAAIILTNSIWTGVNQLETALANDKIPDFEINDEGLQSLENEDVHLSLEGKNGETIIFDTKGETTNIDLQQNKKVTAFLQEELVFKNNGETQTFPYDQIGGFNVSKEDLNSYVSAVDGLLLLVVPVVLLFMYLLSTALKFIGIFSLSVFGLLIKKASPIPLSYRQLWILSAHAVTLPTIALTLLNSLPFQIPWSFSIYWLIAFIWLYLIFTKLPIPKKKTS